ncbi:MAG: hypothetical protein ACFE9L_00930 [Candidatus Hodarchaeota archaeon]
MSNDKSSIELGLGLFFGLIEYDKRPKILWSGSTWHAEINTWDLLLKILAMKDKATLEEVSWNFLPIIWDDIEIFALTKLFQITGVGNAYLVLFHQSPEKLTQFLLQYEEKLAQSYEKILFTIYLGTQLSNEQLKQIRIESQKYYEILSEI